MHRRHPRRDDRRDDFGQEDRSDTIVKVNQFALQQAALLEAQWESQAAELAKSELRLQARDLLQSLSQTVASLEKSLNIDTSPPPRHPRTKTILTPLKQKTTINLDDLEALSELAPGTSLAELLVGLRGPSKQSSRSSSKSRTSFQNVSNPNFGALAQISEDEYSNVDDNMEEEDNRFRHSNRNNRNIRYIRDNRPNNGATPETVPDRHDQHEQRTRTKRGMSYTNSSIDAQRRRRRVHNNHNHNQALEFTRQSKPILRGKRRRKKRPKSAGRSRSRTRGRLRRPMSAGRSRNRTQVSSRLSPPPLAPSFIEPRQKSMKYQLALNALQKGEHNIENDENYINDDEEAQKDHRRSGRHHRPQSAPLGGRGKRRRKKKGGHNVVPSFMRPKKKKNHGEIMSKVEAEVARKEIEALSLAPPTHNEKVKKLHRYNWNQEQAKINNSDGTFTILPPMNSDAQLGKTGRVCSTSRIEHLSTARAYRQNYKFGNRENPPFKTNGGQGLLAKIAYVTGLSNGGDGPIDFSKEHALHGVSDTNQFSPHRRFCKMVTRGGHNVAQKMYNYKLEHLPEYSSLEEGETVISIMACSGCKKHQKTTRHNELKFNSCALQLEAALLEEMPEVKVIQRKVGNRLIGALEVQMCKRVRNRLEKKILHSRIISGTFPTPSAIVKLAKQFMPEHLIAVHVTTSMSNTTSPLLSAKRMDDIIAAFGTLQVVLVPEGGDGGNGEDGGNGGNGEAVGSAAGKEATNPLVSDLVEHGFEPHVQRKQIPAPSVPMLENSPSKRRSPDRQSITHTTVGASTSLMVPPGKYILIVKEKSTEKQNTLFIPIREHIDLTEQTELEVQRTICRKRSIIVRYMKSAMDVVKERKNQVQCSIRDTSTGHVLTSTIGPTGTCLFQPSENTFMHQIEINRMDSTTKTAIGTMQLLSEKNGLKKIEESFISIAA